MTSNKEGSKSDLEEKIAETIKSCLLEAKKKEAKKLVKTMSSAEEKARQNILDTQRENNKIKMDSFMIKIALISFNGALLALMVVSAKNISFGYPVFIFLFISFIVGISQLIFFYFKYEYSYIKDMNFVDKFESIYNFCRENIDDFNTIDNAKLFISNSILAKKSKYANLPELIKDFDAKNNNARIFFKVLLVELLFYLPLLVGFGIVIFKVLLYISNIT